MISKVIIKAALLPFTSAILSACQANGVALEDWEQRHLSILGAELGKLSGGTIRHGVVKISKGCGRISQGTTTGYDGGGKLAHASIRFQREAEAASAYRDEFGTDLVMPLTEAGRGYIVATALSAKASKEKRDAAPTVPVSSPLVPVNA